MMTRIFAVVFATGTLVACDVEGDGNAYEAACGVNYGWDMSDDDCHNTCEDALERQSARIAFCTGVDLEEELGISIRDIIGDELDSCTSEMGQILHCQATCTEQADCDILGYNLNTFDPDHPARDEYRACNEECALLAYDGVGADLI